MKVRGYHLHVADGEGSELPSPFSIPSKRIRLGQRSGMTPERNETQ